MSKDIDKYISVSVIVPIYNNEKYISQCIKSILCQTLDNIEIILINDCSVDSTLNILNSFKKDSRITIINLNHNIGSGIARNIGIMISKAKYIAFIDGDDLYPDIDVLESLYNNALSQKALICGGSLYTIDENNNIKNLNIKKQVFNNYGWIKFINYQYIGGFYRFIYEREFLKKNHIYFPKYRRFQDAIFLLYAMIRAKKFYIINKYVYSYRKNYKKIIWDYVKSRDHLLCIFEILKISKKNKYTI